MTDGTNMLAQAFANLEQEPDNIYPGEVSDDDIAELEVAWRIALPPSYIAFLKKFGGGNFRYLRLYSVASEDETFFDLMEQAQSHALNHASVRQGEFMPIADDYEGTIYCFDLSRSRDGEFVIVELSSNNDSQDEEPMQAAQSFADLLTKLETQHV